MASSIGKIPVFAGLWSVLLGLLVMGHRTISFLGRLPGDIVINKKNVHVQFPVTPYLLLSLLLSFLFYIFNRK